MKSICIISQRYPCDATPTVHVFVKKLVWALADEGFEVSVISPVPLWSRVVAKVEEVYEEYTTENNKIMVYRPRFFYAGERCIAGIKLSHISADTMTKACRQVIYEYNINPDVFYGHFICVAGICACRLGKEFNKPAYIAYGESTDWSIRNFGLEQVKYEVEGCTGFVAVSSSNKMRLIENGIASAEKIGVFVNGINTQTFYRRNQNKCRKKFGLPLNDFIVSYVGQFSERKGVLRLMTAVKQCPGVKVICAGSGKETPEGEQLLYSGRVNPEHIPDFLCASDVFVLPTRNEGCSNAVLEAIACGLPVISSDKPFNYDILDEFCSILVDPDDIEAIAKAIQTLQHDGEKREQMAECAVLKASSLTLKERACKIAAWIEERNQFALEQERL